MRKHDIEASIELNFYNESIVLLGAHEKDQINQWLISLQKAKKFTEWISSVRSIIQGQSGVSAAKVEALSD